MKNTKLQVITVLEPTWNDHVHLPGNLGLLRIVRQAYPDACLNYVGGEGQIRLIKDAGLADLETVRFYSWAVNQDRDTLPTEVFGAIKRLKQLPEEVIVTASMLVYCSITATSLNAVNMLGFAKKTLLMLHGNANDLDGWRSRNPFRRFFDLRATLARYCRNGGTTLALEDRIVSNLKTQHPWMGRNIFCLLHPLTPEEAANPECRKHLTSPIRIGFAGNASLDKGFAEFAELARKLATIRPGQFEFHAIGRLAKDAEKVDQTALHARAGADALDRIDYVEKLRAMHFLFVWHRDNYYGNAASGVVYDAINLGIPLISRKTGQLAEWQLAGTEIALVFDNIATAISHVSNLGTKDEQHYAQLVANIALLRESFSIDCLSIKFMEIAKPILNSTCNHAEAMPCS